MQLESWTAQNVSSPMPVYLVNQHKHATRVYSIATGVDLQELHDQLTAQLKGMRDKQTAAQAALDDLSTEHTHLQEAHAIRARQREEVKLLEVRPCF